MLENGFDIGRTAKPASKKNIERLPFVWNLGIELIRVPADITGPLHGFERLVETSLADKTERAHEIGNHLDMKCCIRCNAVIASGDAG